MKDFAKNHALIAGTILLTATGFLSRILGFFYRIFLSRAIGAEGLGIYQMIFPIHGICFALCAGSIQTAISQMVAAGAKKGRDALRTGLLISLSVSCVLALIICRYSDFLATYILMEKACAPLLPAMALSIPFSAIHACICGYYYGKKRTKVPAFSQLIEQVIRIFAVFMIARVLTENGREITVRLAAWGLLIGEAASAVYSILAYNFRKLDPEEEAGGDGRRPESLYSLSTFRQVAIPLMVLAIPLMGNRLVLNILQSVEAIFIPNRLQAFGLKSAEALSIYGVFTGMALPFIMFPSAITNSLAVMLLPTVAEAQAMGNQNRIQNTIAMSLRYSLYMGILCIGIFTLFGDALGVTVFHNKASGSFIATLAWLCPFMYMATTLGSILNGLGRTSATFLHNILSLALRLGFVMFGIPKYGILAYLWGMLVSELLLALLHIAALHRQIKFSTNPMDMIVKPAFCLAVAIGILFASTPFWESMSGEWSFIRIGIQIGILCLCYGGMLLLFHKKRAIV